jgi:hypothetical protein
MAEGRSSAEVQKATFPADHANISNVRLMSKAINAAKSAKTELEDRLREACEGEGEHLQPRFNLAEGMQDCGKQSVDDHGHEVVTTGKRNGNRHMLWDSLCEFRWRTEANAEGRVCSDGVVCQGMRKARRVFESQRGEDCDKVTRRRRGCRGRRAGRRRKRERHMEENDLLDRGVASIFLGNITEWSSHAAGRAEQLNDEVALVVEIHLDQTNAREKMNMLTKKGWVTTAAPAARTERSTSGTSGGVFVMAKRRWSSRALTDCTDFKGSLMPHNNLAGRMVRLGECEVMILGACFKCNEGLAGTNLVLLRNIEFLTRTG